MQPREGCQDVESGQDSQSSRFFSSFMKMQSTGKAWRAADSDWLAQGENCHQQGPRVVPHFRTWLQPRSRRRAWSAQWPVACGVQGANEQAESHLDMAVCTL